MHRARAMLLGASSAAAAQARAVVLTGPTAVGKTSLSIQLAKTLNAEIISADSVQVYKGMDIGSDKVSLEDQAKVPHHLIDSCGVYDVYSSGDFFEHAMELSRDIVARGKTPLIVGGTWFYLNFLLHGRPSAPRSNVHVEAEIMRRYDTRTDWDVAHRDLRSVDEESAERIDRNDWYRLARALSVHTMTGKPFSSFKDQRTPGLSADFDVTCLYLTAPRWLLFDRIDQRCEHLVERGLVEETLQLAAQGLEPHMHAAKSIGYRQVFEFLDTFWLKPSRKTKLMRRKGFMRFLLNYQAATRRLCAKQMRAFRADPSYAWIVRDEATTEDQLVEQVLALVNKDVEPESLGAWDRELNADNLSLLKGHLPTLEVYDDVEAVDEKMLELEEAVVETGRVLDWRVEHLDAAQEPDPRRLRQPTGKASKGERRRSRWLAQVHHNPRLAKKKAKEIEAMLYE